MRTFLFFLFFISNVCAYAQWSPNPSLNNAICNYTSHQMDVQLVSDGSGGAIVVWRDGRNISTAMDIYAQHISSTGALLWNVDGIPVCNAVSDQYAPRLVSDAAGGAIIAWYDNRAGNYDIYAQRINASGVVQWTTDGVAICTATGNQNAHQLLADGSGGAFIVWCDGRTSGPNADIYGQRINASGVVQWTANGSVICNAASLQNIPQLTTDGGTGFFVTWEDWRNFGQADIYAQKVSSNGFYVWSYLGVVICSEPNFAAQYNTKIVADGAGNAIICWQDKRSSSADDIYAQKINTNGVVQWANNGVLICNAAGLQINEQMISDGASGAIICWEDRRAGQDIYAQRINSSGAVQWTANGIAVCNNAANQLEAQIVAASGGSAIICWTDFRNAPGGDIYAQKISNTGSAFWTANGVAVSNAGNDQAAPAMIPDGNDNAIIAWRDLRTANDYDIYASRLLSNGTLPINLLEFKCIEASETVELQWKTSNEINNAGFDIERSADAVHWEKLAFKPASQSASTVVTYYFTDARPLDGIAYYRLKQIDRDGIYSYSKTISVNRSKPNYLLRVWPNPTSDVLDIRFAGNQISGSLFLYNASGQLVLQQTISNQPVYHVNLKQLPGGTYHLVCISEKEKISIPVIKK